MTDDLDRVYARRFGTTEQASKEDVWDPIVDFLERFFVDGPVLDIASDRGYFIRHAPGTERWATDLRNVADSLPPDVRFVQGDGLALREVLPTDYFAVAFLSNYLEHLPSRDAATTSAPSRASATIGSTICGSSEPSAIEIRTYAPADASIPAFIALSTPRPRSLRRPRRFGISAVSSSITGTVVSPSKS